MACKHKPCKARKKQQKIGVTDQDPGGFGRGLELIQELIEREKRENAQYTEEQLNPQKTLLSTEIRDVWIKRLNVKYCIGAGWEGAQKRFTLINKVYVNEDMNTKLSTWLMYEEAHEKWINMRVKYGRNASRQLNWVPPFYRIIHMTRLFHKHGLKLSMGLWLESEQTRTAKSYTDKVHWEEVKKKYLC